MFEKKRNVFVLSLRPEVEVHVTFLVVLQVLFEVQELGTVKLLILLAVSVPKLLGAVLIGTFTYLTRVISAIHFQLEIAFVYFACTVKPLNIC